MKVFNLLLYYFFLTGFIPETNWLSGVENGRIYYLIKFKQERKQIEYNLIIFEIRYQTGFNRCINNLNIFHQKIEVFEFRILANFTFKLFSTCF
jgi:hypothetical protein